MSRLLLPTALQPMAGLGRVVRRRRDELGLSQQSLAERAGLDRTYLSGLECGHRNPTVQTLFRLAVGLQTPPGHLVGLAAREVDPDDWYASAVRRGSLD